MADELFIRASKAGTSAFGLYQGLTKLREARKGLLLHAQVAKTPGERAEFEGLARSCHQAEKTANRLLRKMLARGERRGSKLEGKREARTKH